MLNKLFLVYPSLLFNSFYFLLGQVLVPLKAKAFKVADIMFLVIRMYASWHWNNLQS